jgi:hypothetical protein
MTRGLVVPLTREQIVIRALYLAGELTIHELDEHVLLRTDTPERCPTIYYRLNGKSDGFPAHNGGKNPRATDPADRWSKPGSAHVNVTSDCVGGSSWCQGFDRFQERRFAHVRGYDGWINTDSMLWEARNAERCFVDVGRPDLGTMIVCRSGSPGHKVGHVGTVTDYKLAEWDPTVRACWDAIEVVDIAGRKGRANMRTTGRGWFGTGAGFLRSVMQP